MFRTLLLLLACTATSEAKVFRIGLGRIPRQTLALRLAHLDRADAKVVEQNATESVYGGYTINVTLGTPPQPFALLLDTSSSNVWVIDAACSSRACTGEQPLKHRQFNKSKSKTFKDLHKPLAMKGSIGGISGELGQDVLNFAGFTVKQQIGVIQTLPDFYADMAFDGTFGLGWPSLAADGATPPLQNVLSQLDKPLFSIWLGSKSIDDQGDQAGAITYGALDADHCNSQWNYVPLSSLSYWQFEVSGVQIRNTKFTRRQQVNAAIAAPWLYGPVDQVAAIVKAVGGFDMFGDGFYYVDCTNGLPTLPDIVFTAGGNKFVVPGSAYLDPDEQELGRFGEYQCQLKIFAVSGAGFGPVWHLGEPFLKTFCSAYDIGGKRIGFSPIAAQ